NGRPPNAERRRDLGAAPALLVSRGSSRPPADPWEALLHVPDLLEDLRLELAAMAGRARVLLAVGAGERLFVLLLHELLHGILVLAVQRVLMAVVAAVAEERAALFVAQLDHIVVPHVARHLD